MSLNRWYIALFAGKLVDSAELFDQSSVDVTAHILEGWGHSGYTLNDYHVKEAIRYFKDQQEDFGGWEGRWGCKLYIRYGRCIPWLSSSQVRSEGKVARKGYQMACRETKR